MNQPSHYKPDQRDFPPMSNPPLPNHQHYNPMLLMNQVNQFPQASFPPFPPNNNIPPLLHNQVLVPPPPPPSSKNMPPPQPNSTGLSFSAAEETHTLGDEDDLFTLGNSEKDENMIEDFKGNSQVMKNLFVINLNRLSLVPEDTRKKIQDIRNNPSQYFNFGNFFII